MRSTGRDNRTWTGLLSLMLPHPAHRATAPTDVSTDQQRPAVPNSPYAARYTEVDGWVAAWRRERENIRILRVRLSSGAPVELSIAGTHLPDLAEMRERFPEHARLWDAVRHDFWMNALPEGRTG